MDFLGIGLWELLVIIVITFLLVGPGKVVSVMRSFGTIIHTFKKSVAEFSSQVNRELEEQKKKETSNASHKSEPLGKT
jgi:TatA/E family protein of Tat protein translocase